MRTARSELGSSVIPLDRFSGHCGERVKDGGLGRCVSHCDPSGLPGKSARNHREEDPVSHHPNKVTGNRRARSCGTRSPASDDGLLVEQAALSLLDRSSHPSQATHGFCFSIWEHRPARGGGGRSRVVCAAPRRSAPPCGRCRRARAMTAGSRRSCTHHPIGVMRPSEPGVPIKTSASAKTRRQPCEVPVGPRSRRFCCCS